MAHGGGQKENINNYKRSLAVTNFSATVTVASRRGSRDFSLARPETLRPYNRNEYILESIKNA